MTNAFFLCIVKVSWCGCERADSSVVAFCPSVHHLSGDGSSDKCATCREVNGGIELWSGPECQERCGANFQQQGYNGMCVPICECLCVFV